MQTQGIPNRLFQGLSEYTPHTLHQKKFVVSPFYAPPPPAGYGPKKRYLLFVKKKVSQPQFFLKNATLTTSWKPLVLFHVV